MGYQFSPPFVDSDFTYFIPRGHKTAGTQKGAAGYVHGGATPEEVIVPVAVFKEVESQWREPKSRFIGLKLDPGSNAAVFHVQRIAGIEVAIQNSNPDPLRIVRVEIIKPESSEVREFNPCEIDGHKEKRFNIKCYFKNSATRENELLLRAVYRYGEAERELLLSLKSTFKTAMTGGFSLKNLKRLHYPENIMKSRKPWSRTGFLSPKSPRADLRWGLLIRSNGNVRLRHLPIRK